MPSRRLHDAADALRDRGTSAVDRVPSPGDLRNNLDVSERAKAAMDSVPDPAGTSRAVVEDRAVDRLRAVEAADGVTEPQREAVARVREDLEAGVPDRAAFADHVADAVEALEAVAETTGSAAQSGADATAKAGRAAGSASKKATPSTETVVVALEALELLVAILGEP
jgi:hypothetical protein